VDNNQIYSSIIDTVEDSELFKLLGLEITNLTKGFCELYLPKIYENDFITSIYCIICDIASLIVLSTLFPEGGIPQACNISVSAFSKVDKGGLKISSGYIEAEYGVLIESKVFTNDGKLVAIAHSRY